ncbi:FAD-dependent oxidoreductase [Caulobacter sp. BE254]|uniref:NAD(P)/FAD-dependent oxidoreductase n=1 Tax=Caulobacter sp. BE254 TaxID=2817720 RepID=UPI00286B5B50|nr:FAD-dependent oxidoreductase [Caulobacter sp. BE254]
MSGKQIVILGAGHAGGCVAAYLRQYGHEGSITLVGEEPIAPYQRPPLSKAWLKGEADAETLALRPLAFYADSGIDFRPNVRAITINRSTKTVTLSAGGPIAYDILIIATGARPMTLPVDGADLPGVLFLRTAADAEHLKAALGPGRRLAVIGAGYIGLEAAASARALGSDVVVIERESRILARVACDVLSSFFQARHEARGVRFILGGGVTAFEGADGAITGVRLSDGRVVACDAALVGVGAVPNDDLAAAAGLECARGVVVDLQARTADPSIFAIGDVAHRPMPIYQRMLRMESVPNALEQAKQAASAIVGRPPPAGETPWQWSDQYDIKLQIAGYPFDVDDVLVRGDPAAGSFAVFHMKGDQIQAVEAINAPPEFMMGRQLIGNRKAVDRARLIDPSVSMKEVFA